MGKMKYSSPIFYYLEIKGDKKMSEKLVSVRNRNNGSTGYTLPDSNVRRSFAPGERKNIPLDELKSLQYAPGGEYLLENLLVVEDESVLKELNMKVEPEYFYNEQKIREMLLTAEMDDFLDFLDFAPEGAIEIAKDIAVKEQIPDTRKRKAISNKTGFNIDNAIMVNEVMDAEDRPQEEEPKKERRVKVEEPKPTGRRVAAPEVKVPNYKVVK
jgi:hypothetical protein